MNKQPLFFSYLIHKHIFLFHQTPVLVISTTWRATLKTGLCSCQTPTPGVCTVLTRQRGATASLRWRWWRGQARNARHGSYNVGMKVPHSTPPFLCLKVKSLNIILTVIDFIISFFLIINIGVVNIFHFFFYIYMLFLYSFLNMSANTNTNNTRCIW